MTLFLLAAIIFFSGADKYRASNQEFTQFQKHASHLPFYRITHAGSSDTSYLFGTLHLLEGSYVDTLPRVMAALRRADIVIGELAVDSMNISDALSGLFNSPPLDSLVKPNEYDEIERAVKKYAPVPLAVIRRAEPIVIYTIILEGMYAKAHPENQTTGIAMDLYFQQEAEKHSIPVMGLEAASDQESALDSIPIQEQTEELVDLVRHPETEMKQMNEMLADYRMGRIAEILDDPSFGSLSANEKSSLLFNRNRKWVDTLQTLLLHHSAFIAVGAGHLAGKQGLIEQLRKRGYDVVWVETK